MVDQTGNRTVLRDLIAPVKSVACIDDGTRLSGHMDGGGVIEQATGRPADFRRPTTSTSSGQ